MCPQPPSPKDVREEKKEDVLQDKPHPALTGSLFPPESYEGQVMNFSPGPTSLPVEVETEIQKRCFAPLLSKPTEVSPRLSTIALSHRSPEFGNILDQAVVAVRQVMEIPEEYEVLFAHGGGHGQFAALPLNLCSSQEDKATYIVNGTWGVRAVAEAQKYCTPQVISSQNQQDGTYSDIPSFDNVDPESKYCYICSNETVNGIEYHKLPRLNCDVPLVVDASSDFSSKPVEWREANVGVLFACASKNIGHPGVTMVVVRKDLLDQANPFCPGVLNYTTNLASGNLWNTIATFNVHVVMLVMEWIAKEGGIHQMEKLSIAKSRMVYDVIDQSDGFYSCAIGKESGLRSRMNAPFDVAGGDETLTNKFLIEAWERGIVGLRTLTPFGVGQYLRASFYHGVSVDYTSILADFMADFAANNKVQS
jgi:phosphoserine aminotransferase